MGKAELVVAEEKKFEFCLEGNKNSSIWNFMTDEEHKSRFFPSNISL